MINIQVIKSVLCLFCSCSLVLSAVLSKNSEDTWSFVAAVYEHRPSMLHLIGRDVWQDIENNLKTYEEQMQIAASKGAEILVFPEDGIFGMTQNRSSIYPYLELVGDPEETIINPCTDSVPSARNRIQRRLSCAAKWYKIYVVANFGTVEFCQDKPLCPTDGRFQFNTNVVFDSEGNIVGRYRKQNLFYEDQFDIPPKVDWTVFGGPFGNFGTFTCFDILFSSPAIDLIEQVGVRNIAFPTAWQNVLPEMFSLSFHESWAVRMGVNLLSAEIHFPEVDMQGSAIYSSQRGAIAFYNNDRLLSPPRLIISNVTAPPQGPIIAPVDLPSNPKSLIPKANFTSFVEGDPFVFAKLTGKKGEAFLEYMETKCYLKYETVDSGNEDLFGFGIFQGLHKSYLNSYVQVCALVRCANSSLDSCGQKTRTSATLFKSLSLAGQFSNQYIFPGVLVDGANPSKKDWTFHLDKHNLRGEINFGSEEIPLLSAILYTRIYERDNNAAVPEYKNLFIKQSNFKDIWHAEAIGNINDEQRRHENSLEAVGIVSVVAVLSCVVIVAVFYKKQRKYQHYTQL